MTYIRASIFVEKDNHRKIIIGRHGSLIKQIGIEARQEIVEYIGHKVYLDLQVRVRENWRDSEDVLDLIEGQKGYDRDMKNRGHVPFSLEMGSCPRFFDQIVSPIFRHFPPDLTTFSSNAIIYRQPDGECSSTVRASDCGSEGWGFDSPHSPHLFFPFSHMIEQVASCSSVDTSTPE